MHAKPSAQCGLRRGRLRAQRFAERGSSVYTGAVAEPLVFVLQHTHWDREWYHPSPRFRKRLVDLIDELLDDPPNGVFLLDGQAIVLRDYLAVRPERAAELSAALQRGNLEAGPWYVLADELIPSGEALVRNLLAGRRTMRASRGEAPPVLYCPDSFGHPAALPAIAAGFGCSATIVWRGYGSSRFPKGDAAWWLAPGGEQTLLFHLPPDGYEAGSHLPADEAAARKRWVAMRAILEPRSTLGVWLVPNGADHHAPQRDIAAAITALRQVVAPTALRMGGLRELGDVLKARAADTPLPKVAGELRDSYGYTWTLGGTFATRAHQKRSNALIERDLVRDVEPWSALTRLTGRPSIRHHVISAWEMLLTTHPHDSLCGCSADAVADAMDIRQREAAALALEIRESAVAGLIGHDSDDARSQMTSWQSALIVRNRAPRARAGIAEVALDVPQALIPVGPHSAGRSKTVTAPPAVPDLPLQILSREELHARIEAPRSYPINHAVERQHALVWLPNIPAYGISAFPLGERPKSARPMPTVRADTRGVYTDRYSLTRSKTGMVLRDASAKRSVSSLVGFEIVGERGDTYTHSPVPRSRGIGVMRGSRVGLRGPLRGAIDSTWRVARGDQKPREGLEVIVRASLDAGTDFVRLHVFGVNWSTDHRLRLVVRTGVKPRDVLADAAFALIERKQLRISRREMRAEAVPGTDPLHRFVTLFDGPRGCTIVSDGLAEYTVMSDGSVAITLVRAVGELSRADLPERPGHAGWPVATPGAQSIGAFEAGFGLFWHDGDSSATRASVLSVVDDVLLPLTGHTQRDLTVLPDPIPGVALEGSGLAFSTLKESDDGRFIVARCVNVADEPVDGAWVFPRRVAAAHVGRLDETPLEALSVQGNRVEIRVAARGIHTILIPVESAGNRR